MKAAWWMTAGLALVLAGCGSKDEAPAPEAAAPVSESAPVDAPAAMPELPAEEPPPPSAEAAPVAEPDVRAPSAPSAPAAPASATPAPAAKVAPKPAESPVTSAIAEPSKSPVAAAEPPAPSPAPAKAADLVLGKQVYQQSCSFCHDRGAANAPRLGDAAAWNARLARGGIEALYTATIRGKGAMPPRGGNPALSDDAIQAAVDYLLAESR